jgi:hypothetical protein
MQEDVGIGTIKKQELGPTIIVVSGCQVQEIAVLVLNVVLEDAELQSAVKIPTLLAQGDHVTNVELSDNKHECNLDL